MIDYVYGGEYLIVNSNKGYTPTVNTYQPITGMVAYDGTNQTMKIFDGNSWQQVGGGTANINLTPSAITALKWAERKMQEEYALQALAESNPTIKDLVDQMNTSIADYQHKIAMVKSLLQSDVQTA